MAQQSVLSVSQLNRYVKSVLEGDFRLQDLLICGEISNFVNHYKSGHYYFTLKEGNCAIKAVMFASYAKQIRFTPQDGMAVFVRGSVSLYERDGSYQLYVYDMQPQGKGSLQAAYEQLLEKLKAEGLFDQSRKKAIPRYPQTIGIITSDTGAALHDMLNILSRRYPPAHLILYPALVQGDGAPASLIGGIDYFDRTNSCDVILIGRGGGSLEDLWAFNNEELVRRIAQCRIPVISAVGHETDVTLCDFAADLRAPTPSAAAELAVPDAQVLLHQLNQTQENLTKTIQRRFFEAQQDFDTVSQRDVFKNWREYLDKDTKKLKNLAVTIQIFGKNDILRKREQLKSRIDQLTLLNPWERLNKGYSITETSDGKILHSVTPITCGDCISTQLADGRIISRVEQILPAAKKGEQ